MSDKFNGWSHLDQYELNKVIDLVITKGTIETVYPDTHIFSMFGSPNESLKILDFGCGVCRNTGYLANTYSNWNIYGYDNDNMLKHASDFCDKKYSMNVNNQLNLTLTSDWESLKTKKFDVIFALLVFQHIYESDINTYLNDIKQMTSTLIVSGRRFNDEIIDGKYKNTWQIFENNGLYPINTDSNSYKVEGNPEDHTLCVYKFT